MSEANDILDELDKANCRTSRVVTVETALDKSYKEGYAQGQLQVGYPGCPEKKESDHVCGLQGYNGMIDPPCPGCERRNNE